MKTGLPVVIHSQARMGSDLQTRLISDLTQAQQIRTSGGLVGSGGALGLNVNLLHKTGIPANCIMCRFRAPTYEGEVQPFQVVQIIGAVTLTELTPTPIHEAVVPRYPGQSSCGIVHPLSHGGKHGEIIFVQTQGTSFLNYDHSTAPDPVDMTTRMGPWFDTSVAFTQPGGMFQVLQDCGELTFADLSQYYALVNITGRRLSSKMMKVGVNPEDGRCFRTLIYFRENALTQLAPGVITPDPVIATTES